MANNAANQAPTFDSEFDTLEVSGRGQWTPNMPWATADGRNQDDPSEAGFYVNPNFAPLASASPFSVTNGVLDLATKPVPASVDPSLVGGKPYVSGLLQTAKGFSQLYGYFEMRAELPTGNGVGAAFWLLPEDGSWPPELDVMENLGQDPSTVYQTVHGGTSSASVPQQQVAATVAGGVGSSFHTYGVDWEADKTTFYVDGKQTGQFDTPASMHKPMYMILSDNSTPASNVKWGKPVDGSTKFPADFRVDYVRAHASMPDLPPAASSGTAATSGGMTTGGTTTAQPTASTGTSTAASTATADPGSTSPSGSATQAAAGISATVPAPSSASTGAGAAGTSGSSTKASSAGQFSVANGQIIGPDGTPFVARGINTFLGQADAATILKTFPGINAVRLATTPGADPNAIDALVQGLTSKGVVVVIEDHTSSGGNPNTLSGQALADQASAYAKWASRYQGNSNVWFGSPNEPDNTANPAAIPAQEAAIYDAIRGAGSNAMVLMEMRGGFTNDAAQKSASTYAGMKNVAWDTHYYGWVSKYSTDPAAIAKGLQDQIANAQSVKSADGTVPVVIGEYGPSTTGSGSYDANGLQVVQAVDDSGHGTFAWAWSAGTDTLVNGSGLTDFGQLVAKHIAAGASTPATPVPPAATSNPANPAPTDPNPTNGGGSTPSAPVGTGADTLVLNLSEDAYKGDAQFTLTVDGKAVGDAQAVTASHGQGQSEAFTFEGDWDGGPHTVGVTFVNDRYDGTAATDRNLYIDGATFDGGQVEGKTPLYGRGTVSFGVGSTAAALTAPAGTLSVIDSTGSSTSLPLITMGNRTDSVGGGTISQVAKDGTDTLTTSGNVKSETATLGGGTRKLILVNPRPMTLTGGSGMDTVSADSGSNRYVAGSGSLDVTGGPGADDFVLHAGAGQLTVEDFDADKGDTLSIDKSLQGSLKQASDGHGGTLLSFGTGAGTIDLINHGTVGQTSIQFI